MKKQSSYFPIKDLTTWTTRWVLCARVGSKTPISTFKRADGSNSKVFNVDITDHHGDCIRATFWGDAVDKWFSVLEEGEVYTFSNGRVQVANKRYSNLPHEYSLVFDSAASIEHQKEDNSENKFNVSELPRLRNYNFVTLREIYKSSRTFPYLVDLLVAVKKLAPNTEEFISRNTQQPGKRRLCVVADDTGFEMQLTLFGDHTSFLDSVSDTINGDVNIVAIQNVQVIEFRNGINGSTLRASHFSVNPDLPEAERLRKWMLSSEAQSCSWTSLSDNRFGNTNDSNTVGARSTFNSLEDISNILPQLPISGQEKVPSNNNGIQDTFTVIAEASGLLYANRNGELTLSYQACSQCNRKLKQDISSDGFRCDVCDISVENPVYRYVYGLYLVDETSGRFLVRTFHEPGQVLIGKDATELSNEIKPKTPVESLPIHIRQLLDYDNLWKKFTLRLKARREYFGDQLRNIVSIIYAEPLNRTKHGRIMLEKVKMLLKETPSYPPKKMAKTMDLKSELNIEDESLFF